MACKLLGHNKFHVTVMFIIGELQQTFTSGNGSSNLGYVLLNTPAHGTTQFKSTQSEVVWRSFPNFYQNGAA